MLKTNYTKSDFTQESAGYQLSLPINVTMLIPEHDSVRLLSQIVEGLDLKGLMMAYSSNGRKPAVPPRIMLKILIYAYMGGIYSSRAIEQCCKRDINFMWLLNGYKAPDHNTISRFRTGRMKLCLESLLTQFVMQLHHEGEIPFENIFIDGTKIEANAGKYTFVWKKAIEKFDAKIPSKAVLLIKKVNETFGTEFQFEADDDLAETLQRIAEFLEEEKESKGIEFVSGVGRRKSDLQRLAEETLSLLERKEKYLDYMREFDGRNSFSKTDRDATFMRMKDDGSRNSQLKPGYNLQVGVENGYVVGIDISSERSDIRTLVPMLEKIEGKFSKLRFYNNVIDEVY
jgi:transposase